MHALFNLKALGSICLTKQCTLEFMYWQMGDHASFTFLDKLVACSEEALILSPGVISTGDKCAIFKSLHYWLPPCSRCLKSPYITKPCFHLLHGIRFVTSSINENAAQRWTRLFIYLWVNIPYEFRLKSLGKSISKESIYNFLFSKAKDFRILQLLPGEVWHIFTGQHKRTSTTIAESWFCLNGFQEPQLLVWNCSWLLNTMGQIFIWYYACVSQLMNQPCF